MSVWWQADSDAIDGLSQECVWGRAGNSDALPLAQMMFYGEAQHNIYNGDAPMERRLDSFYLAMVPWFRLHMLHIEGFKRAGDRTVNDTSRQRQSRRD